MAAVGIVNTQFVVMVGFDKKLVEETALQLKVLIEAQYLAQSRANFSESTDGE